MLHVTWVKVGIDTVYDDAGKGKALQLAMVGREV